MTPFELTFITRAISAFGTLIIAFALFFIRKQNGPVLNAFFWAWFLGVTIPIHWYMLTAAMKWLEWYDSYKFMVNWGWPVWSLSIAGIWNLIRVLFPMLKGNELEK